MASKDVLGKILNGIGLESGAEEEYEEADDDIADKVKAGSFYTTPNGHKTSFSFFRRFIRQNITILICYKNLFRSHSWYRICNQVFNSFYL